MLAPVGDVRPRKLVPVHERLFRLVAELRATSVASLHALFFAPRWGMTLRGAQKHIARLVHDGFLEELAFIGTRSRYRVVHLTATGYAAFPGLEERFSHQVAGVPTDDVAARGWLRGALWASLRRDGYEVS